MKRRALIRRRDGIRQHYRIGRINTRTRKIFTQLSSPEHKIEFGGAINFDRKGETTEISLIPGKSREVDIPDNYLVKWHTHPSEEFDPPSPTDVLALLDDEKQQAEMVFNDGLAVTIIKTPETKKLLNMKRKDLEEKINKAFHSSTTPQDYAHKLSEMGFYVQIDKDTSRPIILKLKGG